MTSCRCGCLSTMLVALALGVLVCVAAASGVPGGLLCVLAFPAFWGYVTWKLTQDERQRRAELRALARVRKELGLDYERNVTAKQMRRYFSLPLFDNGRWRSLGHVMSGPAGEGRVLLFDYRGRTVILFPDVGLPEFELHPRPVWDFRDEGIPFDPEELPEEAGQELMRSFTGSYLVEALEGEEVRRLFSMEKVAFLAGHPGWEVQSYAGHLAMYKRNTIVPLEERPALFREALALAGLFHPPLCPEDPWAGRAGPSAGQIRLKPSRLGDSPHPGPGPASDGRFTRSE